MYPKPIGRFHIFLAEMYIDKDNYKDALKHVNIAKRINPEHRVPQQLYDIINLDNQ